MVDTVILHNNLELGLVQNKVSRNLWQKITNKSH